MFCPKCGKPIPDDSAFCMFCGKSIPQVFPAPLPEERPRPVAPKPPVEAPPDPFGDGPEEPLEEPFFPDPVEPETFAPDLPPDDDLDLPDYDAPRCCTLCGRELPASNTTGICVTCTNNRSFVPSTEPERFELDLDLDAEYPEEFRDEKPPNPKRRKRPEPPPRKKRRLPLLPILIAAILMAGLACFAVYYLQLSGDTDSGVTVSAPNPQDREIAAFAQGMVKAKAANPSSVHFDTRSLSVSEKDGVWTVKQSFERLAPNGEMAQSAYVAMLTQDAAAPEGYKALMLQVDDDTLYDYR